MVIIGTHSGFFHADDVFAVATLTILKPNYQIVRSRDPEVLKECDYLVDVGGIYNPSKDCFDHHFNHGPTYGDGLLKSSFGLVWEKYGWEVCHNNKEVYYKVRQKLVRPIDAADNGVMVYQKLPDALDVNQLSLSSLIAHMNPPSVDDADEFFERQVSWARGVIHQYIAHANKSAMARPIVQTALLQAKMENRQYIELSAACRWQEHLFKLDRDENILFVVYPHQNQWYSIAVPSKNDSFASRKDFPKKWAGLRNEEFAEELGLEDAVFCHHSSFIAACTSRESTLEMTKMAIDS